MTQSPTTKSHKDNDAQARTHALDPNQSFIIQAPAGSGKTELLIQRYLTLLTHVKHPKHICAVTFTKKACGELRTRIQESLALTTQSINTLSEHKVKTRALACRVHKHAQQLNWCIESIALDCNITTIDGMVNQWLSFAPSPYNAWVNYDLIQQKQFYYDVITEFIQQYCLHSVGPLYQDYQAILKYNHCDQDHIIRLLFSALTTREQWLSDVMTSRINTQLATTLANNLEKLHKLHQQSIPTELHLLINQCMDNLINMHETHACAAEAYQKVFALNANSKHWDIHSWQIFTAYTHTSTGTIRKQYQSKHGFLPQQQLKKLDPETQARLAAFTKSAKTQLDAISQSSNYSKLLNEIHSLPIVETNEWQHLQPLLGILPSLVAYLHMSMQKAQKTDYSAKSMQLTMALDDDNHHQLTEALYQQTEHLLIDEFQDTSRQQHALFSALVNLWQGDPHRTITIVGDPMQSIYAFRQADVRLFEHVAKHGIGHIKLTPLFLEKNYRSCETIVQWTNQRFTQMDHTDYFIPAIATNTSSDASVQWTANNNTISEAQYITEQIQDYQQRHPGNTIAILVRSRTQLQQIIPALYQANIAFNARDIDNLSQEQSLLDCLTVYMLAQNLYDRQHWVAILRSPFIGLTWNDIYLLAQPKDSCIWDNMREKAEILSTEGQQLISRAVAIIEDHLIWYQRKPHAMLCLKLWHALGGKWMIKNNNSYRDIVEFYATLGQIDEQNSTLSSYSSGLELLQSIHKKVVINDNAIQIMTVHKAKGLEFDCVVLPGLERMPPLQNKNLINSMQIPTDKQPITLIHTQPKHQAHASKLQQYITRYQQKNTDDEQRRLCYVACTRAKKQLYLHYTPNKTIHPRSWLAFIQPDCIQTNESVHEEEHKVTQKISLNRLPLSYELPPILTNTQHRSIIGIATATNAQLWGDVIHDYMYWLHQGTKTSLTLDEISEKVQLLCVHHKINIKQDHSTLYWVGNKLYSMQNDPIFQWLYSEHQVCKHEQVLLHNKQTLRIDRYFIDQEQTLWVIDFKTYGAEQHSDKLMLPGQVRAGYHNQLANYQQALQAIYPQKHIKKGLYFPLQQHWEAVETDTIAQS